VPDVGRRSFRRFGFVESAVVSRWTEIVGTKLAAITRPDAIKFPQGKRSNGALVLSVAAANAPLVQHDEPRIIEMVNRFFGYAAVARVQLRQTALDENEERPVRRRVKAGPEDVPEEDRPELKAIANDDLRGQLEALAAQIAVTRGPPKIS
jgi:hypothetical protein